jgi:hypothetical protein
MTMKQDQRTELAPERLIIQQRATDYLPAFACWCTRHLAVFTADLSKLKPKLVSARTDDVVIVSLGNSNNFRFVFVVDFDCLT